MAKYKSKKKHNCKNNRASRSKIMGFITKHALTFMFFFSVLFLVQLMLSCKPWFPDIFEKAINTFVAVVAFGIVQIQLIENKKTHLFSSTMFGWIQAFILFPPIMSIAGFICTGNFDISYEYINVCASFYGVIIFSYLLSQKVPAAKHI